MSRVVVRASRALTVAGVLALTGCSAGEPPVLTLGAVVSTVLPSPPEGAAYAPTLALDPANPDHIVVVAMRGIPPTRPSAGIWTWRTTDGGRTWSDQALESPHFPGDSGIQVFGADAVAGFVADGTPIVTSIAGVGARTGTFVSRLVAPGSEPGAVATFENFHDVRNGRGIIFDKPWMVVDRLGKSPYLGSVYVAAAAVVLGESTVTPGDSSSSIPTTSLRLAISRDQGRSFAPLTLVADSAFAARLVLTPGGVLEVTYDRPVSALGSARTVYHRRSTDGGATFGPEGVVATVGGDTLLDLPVLAARPNGDLLSCWSQGVRSVRESNQVRCAVRRANEAWSPVHAVDSALAPGTAEAWPAIVGTERGWYLLQYLVGTSRTEVVLYASADGVNFSRVGTLGALDGLGTDRFCLNSVAGCRRAHGGASFIPGDYITLAASSGRLAAAYVLPRRAAVAEDSATVHVTVTEEPLAR